MKMRNIEIICVLIRTILSPIKYAKFIHQYNIFKQESKKKNRFSLNWWRQYPFLFEATEETSFDHHYVYHPAWAARVIQKINPDCHVDISSTLQFCSMISAFLPVKFYDYRPANLSLSNLTSNHADLTELPFDDNSIQSLSCMHTIEHIGLGRYGDKIDPDGDLKAINELKRVLSNNGDLLFVVPIGTEAKILFNAQRIYSYEQISTYFSEFELVEFSLITDNPEIGDFIRNADPNLTKKCTNGCGCFWFKKIPAA